MGAIFGGDGMNTGKDDEFFRVGLLQLATDLCMQTNGSSDPWTKQREEEVVDYLQRRVANWKPRRHSQTARDIAAKLYVTVAIDEWAKSVDFDNYFIQG